MKKEILKRHLKDLFSKEHLAKEHQGEPFANLVSSHDSHLIKRGPGVDPVLQQNKAVNIRLACAELNGLVIHPGEYFSFWRTVGNTTKRKGYKDGRVIIGDRILPGIGGGLCNLANTIHLMILHSPMDVIEFHQHSDALAPDEGPRKPFSSGTSVSYNNVDYRFQNNTDQDVQLLVWCDEDNLYGEFRSMKPYDTEYRLVEEDHHFHKEENDKFYRISKIYRETLERGTENVLKKELILDNHSEVMFDYDLIPKELIR